MDRSEQKKKWIKEHERLSRLFIEDRLTFERERKRRIDRAISRSHSVSGRTRLRELQRDWDTILKSAGGEHNRFVLIQMLFWNQVRDVWHPSVTEYEKKLKKSFPNTRRHNPRPSLRRIE
jgi:hypothetical protein